MTTMTETPATETALPAEKLNPGFGRQLINVFDPRTGEFQRQKTGHGGEAQVRARAEILFVHQAVDLDRWTFLRAVAIGEFPSGEQFPNSRNDLIDHCATCTHCQTDATDSNDWAGISTMEIAEFVWDSHLLAARDVK